MAVTLSPIGGAAAQFLDNSGNLLSGGKIFTYAAGTTTPQATYTSSGGATAHSNPIILDAAGRVPSGEIWLTDGLQYKFLIKTSADVQIGSYDNIQGINSSDAEQVSYTPPFTGGVTTNVEVKLAQTVSVKDFGAVGDGVADDTAAIQAAANYTNLIGGTLYANSGTYKITSTVTITCNCQMSAALFNVNAALVPIGIIVGSTTQEIRGRVMFLPKINNTAKTSPGWVGFDTSVGIDLANLFMSQVTIPSVLRFGVGVDVGGYNVGNAYNNIFLGELFDNKINLRCRPKGTGYSNQNAFHGGQLGISGVEGNAVTGCYGVSLEGVNNNTFVNTSLEAEGNEYQIRFSDAAVNTFLAPRLEITGGGRLLFASSFTRASQGNAIYPGIETDNFNVTYSGFPTAGNKIIGSFWGDYLSYFTRGLAIVNTNGDASGQPHVTGYSSNSATDYLAKNSATSTDWAYKLYTRGMSGKRYTDTVANSRVLINFESGQLTLGDGFGPATATLSGLVTNNWMAVSGCASFVPLPDNTLSLGASGSRWTTVFATTGAINTSDAREKQDVEALDEAEKRVAIALKSLVKKFRWKEAVEKKSDAARIHVGVIAQDVIAAFQAEGLDPMLYAIVCYDEWDAQAEVLDDNGDVVTPGYEAGNRYGIRYDQLLAFIIGAL